MKAFGFGIVRVLVFLFLVLIDNARDKLVIVWEKCSYK